MRLTATPAGRVETLEVQLVDEAGSPCVGAAVAAEQISHAFGFGCWSTSPA